MGKRGLRLLICLIVAVVLVIVVVVFWPWLSRWLPHPALIEAWIRYLMLDLDIGRWGPVVALLLVAVIELVWALSLGRRSGSFERHLNRVDRLHVQEIEVLNQEITMLKEERRTLLTELDLRDGLIREEKARLWSRFDDLQQVSGLYQRRIVSTGDPGTAAVPGRLLDFDAPELAPDLRAEWRQIITQLERIELVSVVTARKSQSSAQAQQHADELVRLGGACYHLGQYERALAHFDKAVALIPTDSSVLINRGVVNQALGRHKASLRDLERALKLGEDPWAYLYRGLVRERLGEEKRAQEDYTRAIRLDSSLAEAYYRRGLLYAKSKEYEKAFQDQNRVLQLDANHVGAYAARGVTRAALGDYELALRDLDKGCALAPRGYEGFYHRGCVRYQLGMYDDALADFDRVIELAPGFAPVFMVRGDTYLALGQNWQAITNYGQAIELQSKNAAAYHARGVARAAMREYPRAIEDFDRALELDPGMASALADRGSAYEKLGEYDHAIRDLDRAIALDPNLAIAYYNRGLAFGNKGEYDRASRDLNKATELDPSLGAQAVRAQSSDSVEESKQEED